MRTCVSRRQGCTVQALHEHRLSHYDIHHDRFWRTIGIPDTQLLNDAREARGWPILVYDVCAAGSKHIGQVEHMGTLVEHLRNAVGMPYDGTDATALDALLVRVLERLGVVPESHEGLERGSPTTP